MNWMLPALFCTLLNAPSTGPATKPIGELKSRTNIKDHIAPVRALEFSRDGRTLISADAAGVIVLSNGITGKKIRQIDGPKDVAIITLSLAADAKTIFTAHEDGVVRAWDFESGELKRQIEVPSLTAARLSSDGSMLLCTRGTIPEKADNFDHVLVFDPVSGKQLGTVDADLEYVIDASLSSDGTKVAISGGESLTDISPEKGGRQRCRIELWELKRINDKIESKLIRAIGENSPQPLRSPVFSGGGRLIAAASGDWLVWETAGAKQVATLRAPLFKAHSCAFSPSVRWIATGTLDSTVALFNTRDWEMAYKSEGDPSIDVSALAFNPDGSILAAARGRLIELFAIPSR